MVKSKWALITGATSGIGQATALLLAERGCHVILTGRRQDRLSALAQTIVSQYKVEALPLPLDIADSANVERFVSEHKAALDKVSIVINNAGLALGTDPMQKADLQDWETMVQTNVLGLLRVTHHMLPILLKHTAAHVVNLGSISGRWVYPGGVVYCSTKFAVRALSEGLRMDLVGTPVRVTNIEPGMVETEFSQVRFNQDQERAAKVYQGLTPLKAEDIAETIVWCLERPQHVSVSELVIFPTDQAASQLIHRK